MSKTLLTDTIRISVRRAARVVVCVSAMSLVVGIVPSVGAQENREEAQVPNLVVSDVEQDTSTSPPAAPVPGTQDSDGDGVVDDYDACPASLLDAVVDEFGCAQESRITWVGPATGAAVIFILAMLALRFVPRRGTARGALDKRDEDWIVLPVVPSGVAPTPHLPRPGYRGGSSDPSQRSPQVQQGHSPEPWPAQPAFHQRQPYAQQPHVPTQEAPPFGAAGKAVSTNDPAEGPDDPIPEGVTVDAGQVRFHRPPEGTLQILPGRLDVVEGDPGRNGICFVKIPGEEPEVTFGRAVGEQYRHVQLKVSTVSRMHARMRFKDASWSIENLSSTNPVTVNGHALGAGEDSGKALNDGDRIEMGEVIFLYWTT